MSWYAGVASAQLVEDFDETTLWVEAGHWRTAAAAALAGGFTWLELLTAWEDPDGAGFVVVLQLMEPVAVSRVRVATRVASPQVDSLVDILEGVAWHEREAYEMFGIDFVGHPDLRPLLLDGVDLARPPMLKGSS